MAACSCTVSPLSDYPSAYHVYSNISLIYWAPPLSTCSLSSLKHSVLLLADHAKQVHVPGNCRSGGLEVLHCIMATVAYDCVVVVIAAVQGEFVGNCNNITGNVTAAEEEVDR